MNLKQLPSIAPTTAARQIKAGKLLHQHPYIKRRNRHLFSSPFHPHYPLSPSLSHLQGKSKRAKLFRLQNTFMNRFGFHDGWLYNAIRSGIPWTLFLQAKRENAQGLIARFSRAFIYVPPLAVSKKVGSLWLAKTNCKRRVLYYFVIWNGLSAKVVCDEIVVSSVLIGGAYDVLVWKWDTTYEFELRSRMKLQY